MSKKVINVKDWLKEKIAEEKGVDKNDISCDLLFDDFSLDSLSLISISFDLEEYLDEDLSPSLFTEFNTINKLSAWFENKI